MKKLLKNFIKTDGDNNVLELQLNVLVFQQGEFFVSLCPSLNLSSYGDSVQDAKDGFDEVMKSYIEDCTKDGSLHKDLMKLGWTFFSKQTKVIPPAQVELDIPGGALKKQFNENWTVPSC
ncbi:MAG: hypothetical protein E6H09_22790 [Bacteroidetes bacterium]|jgi:hypothetical protein|nr:MAG: hypothetical protein E6H09_22790 [Bacteroidota bacterium]